MSDQEHGLFAVGSSDGELVLADYVKAEGDDNPEYVKSITQAHVGPVVSLERSPFFHDILLTVSLPRRSSPRASPSVRAPPFSSRPRACAVRPRSVVLAGGRLELPGVEGGHGDAALHQRLHVRVLHVRVLEPVAPRRALPRKPGAQRTAESPARDAPARRRGARLTHESCSRPRSAGRRARGVGLAGPQPRAQHQRHAGQHAHHEHGLHGLGGRAGGWRRGGGRRRLAGDRGSAAGRRAVPGSR